VGYEYRIGTYEVTIGQYTKFLNAVAKTDTYGLYNTFMGTDLNIAGISRSGSPGSYTYAVMNNGGDSSNRPITYVRWFDAARFANWMHNGQPMGAQNASTTEDGAYTLNGATEGTAPAKNAVVRFYIPTENEWYKAAYYKGGSTNAGYWDYATKSDSAPGNTIGSGANQANYYAGDFAVTQSESYSESQNYLTNVGAFTNSASYYGTFDQSGNVYEWSDLDGTAGSSRGLRGGRWYDDASPPLSSPLSSSNRLTLVPSFDYFIGFRLASPV
jgi:formylglycine-generating enzyme required for sulfatase activity